MTEEDGKAVVGVTYTSRVWVKTGSEKCNWLYPLPKNFAKRLARGSEAAPQKAAA